MEKRNVYIDYLKLICSFFVVYIHSGKNFGLLKFISVVAVPIFFIISGYLYHSFTAKKGNQLTYILKIAKMFLTSFAFYIIYSGILRPFFKGESVISAIKEQISLVAIAKLLLLNAPICGYHLWYLSALVYVLCIEMAIDEFACRRNSQNSLSDSTEHYVAMYAFVLLSIGIIIPLICSICKLPFRIEIARNFLFEGFPMFHIGKMIAERCSSGNLSQKTNKTAEHFHAAKAAVIMICLFIGLIIEQIIYDKIKCYASLSVFTVLLSMAIFISAVKMDTVKSSSFQKIRMPKLLIRSTTGIYLIHIAVLTAINCLDILSNGLIKSVLCFLVSFFLVAIWQKLKEIRNAMYINA